MRLEAFGAGIRWLALCDGLGARTLFIWFDLRLCSRCSTRSPLGATQKSKATSAAQSGLPTKAHRAARKRARRRRLAIFYGGPRNRRFEVIKIGSRRGARKDSSGAPRPPAARSCRDGGGMS